MKLYKKTKPAHGIPVMLKPFKGNILPYRRQASAGQRGGAIAAASIESQDH